MNSRSTPPVVITEPQATMSVSTEAKLLADIGGSYARFAIERANGVLSDAKALPCADYPDFLSALRAYIDMVGAHDIRHGAIAIANPVEGDLVRMTNYHWQFSIEATRQAVGFNTLLVVNDFTALAMGLPHLTRQQFRQVGGGAPRERSVIGLVGAGTGLGVSGLIPVDDGWVSLASEGGHIAFAPQTAREMIILEYAWRQYPHVSEERLVSASGIELIYAALADKRGGSLEALKAPEITQRGLAGECAVCAETLEVFCELLGTAAAGVAVTLGAFGGVYIGGGIVPRLGSYFDKSGFRSRFEAMGRLSKYVANIPTFVITSDTSTFTGTSAILDAELRRRGGGSSLLDRVRQSRESLSAAERRVADLVLSQPRSVLNDPIMEIATRAGVSQPTVVRFCRSLGCEGLSDFKLKLASGLTGTIPVTHTQVKRTDSTHELGAKVLDNTASAVLKVRDQLNSEAVDRAIALLLNARRIDFYALGNYSVIAQDAQYKFLRFGVPAAAYTDTRLQLLAANAIGAGDVVVAISGSGKIAELLKAVDMAMAAGAAVIAITPSHAPLAKKTTVTIAIDHPEDVTMHIPMISRLLYMVVIDILATGVAMRHGGAAHVPAARDKLPEDAETAASRAARTDYTRIISHSG
ncbi:MAG TPA: glucokinase [Burkholderiaceae bacterium]|nr:glucokinase [Burkholderiaceae bacterium]